MEGLTSASKDFELWHDSSYAFGLWKPQEHMTIFQPFAEIIASIEKVKGAL